MALNIWFNRSYATTYWVMGMLRANPSGVDVRLFASHIDMSSPVLAAADVVEAEPELRGNAYVDWALGFCRRHAIDVFVPRLAMLDVSRRLPEFSELGVAVLTSPADALAVLGNKDLTYRSASALGVPVPPWRTAATADEFEMAYDSLRTELEPGERVCMKPTVGVGGDGFRILDDSPLSMADLLAPPAMRASVRDVLGAMRSAQRDRAKTPTFLLMPYLDGPEVSVDCLSRDGQLLAAVPRSKQARHSALTPSPEAVEIAEQMVRGYGLAYLTNTQVRRWRGESVLLETNTRMSGGLFQTALTGANLAWGAVQIALGEEVTLPRIQLGAEFTQVLGVVPMTRMDAADPVAQLDATEAAAGLELAV